MQVPEDVRIALENIRSTLELRYNRQAVLTKAYSFDANGKPRHREYEPRWELWDVDGNGVPYKVMTLQDRNGNALEPGRWLPDLMWQIDPARFGGDVSKMAQEWVDKPNEYVALLEEEELRNLATDLEERCYDSLKPRSAVSKQLS